MEDKDLEILQVKSLPEYDTKRFEKLHKHLLKPPFLGIFNAPVRSGKSTMIMNLIYNKNFYNGLFDKIIYFSPTVRNDKTLQHLSTDEDEHITIIDENLDEVDEVLKAIVADKMDSEKDEEEDTRNEQWLVIMDDMLGFIKPKGFVSTFCSKYRHSRVSLIFTTQLFRAIPNIIRANATWYIIWQTNNKKEYAKLEEEFGGIFPNFEKLYDEATNKPYHFLYLDLRNIKALNNDVFFLIYVNLAGCRGAEG